MKNALLTVCCLLVAVGIFASMVLYTVALLRQFKYQILTGETAANMKLAAYETNLKSVPGGADFCYMCIALENVECCNIKNGFFEENTAF